MNDADPLKSFVKGIAEELTRQLYPDVKAWTTCAAKWIRKQYKKRTADIYRSPTQLLDALQANQISDGDWVTLECKPALFGPFLRQHFLSFIIGNHTEMRLGPPIMHQNPMIGMMLQTTTHLAPVALYPPVGDGINQAVLYPSDARVCGLRSPMPMFGINEFVQHIPALLASRHTTACNKPCKVTGIIRMIDAATLIAAGFNAELHEELRQAGTTWFLDATDDGSECALLNNGTLTELWGGLYASGHLEIASGQLRVERVVEAMRNALQTAGYEPRVAHNEGKVKQEMVYSKGIRILLDCQAPIYSIHMDAELGNNFKASRERFDHVTLTALNNIERICLDDSVDLMNKMDLDFSYTDSARAFSVMQSQGATNIKEPLCVAIRDWHRRRNAT